MPPQVVGEGKGIVKFFNPQKGFGFIVRDDGAYYIEDLGSSNGTWFNKQRIKRKQVEDGARSGDRASLVRDPDVGEPDDAALGLGHDLLAHHQEVAVLDGGVLPPRSSWWYFTISGKAACASVLIPSTATRLLPRR